MNKNGIRDIKGIIISCLFLMLVIAIGLLESDRRSKLNDVRIELLVERITALEEQVAEMQSKANIANLFAPAVDINDIPVEELYYNK